MSPINTEVLVISAIGCAAIAAVFFGLLLPAIKERRTVPIRFEWLYVLDGWDRMEGPQIAHAMSIRKNIQVLGGDVMYSDLYALECDGFVEKRDRVDRKGVYRAEYRLTTEGLKFRDIDIPY